MSEYKSLNKYLNKKSSFSNDVEVSRGVKSFISKVLICCILFILFMIGNKSSSIFSNMVYENVYNDTFSFASVNYWYNENFGSVFPLDNFFGDTKMVFNEKLSYKSSNLYKDGVALNVSLNYLVPVINNGIVIFMGNKYEYGNTLVIQQEDGVNVWYCNINVSDIDMYDYVNSGEFIGEVVGETLYLVFEKDGEFLDYKNYI